MCRDPSMNQWNETPAAPKIMQVDRSARCVLRGLREPPEHSYAVAFAAEVQHPTPIRIPYGHSRMARNHESRFECFAQPLRNPANGAHQHAARIFTEREE